MKTEDKRQIGAMIVVGLLGVFIGISMGKTTGRTEVYKENVKHQVMYKEGKRYYWLNEFKLVGIDK